MRASACILSVVGICSVLGCSEQYHARVKAPVLAPPEKREVLHTGRLFIELEGYTEDRQCRTPPGWRILCYERVHRAVSRSLHEVLWPSFPHVAVRGHAEDLEPGDYILLISLALETVPPGAHGAGWSAGLKGQYRLVRDGMPVSEAQFESRSRAEFAYGRALGVAAGEVIGAVAAHLGQVLAEVPEPNVVEQQPLPAVVTMPIPPTRPIEASPSEAPSPRPNVPSVQAVPVALR